MTGYERFVLLCGNKGITPSAAMIKAGLSKALATKWKQGESYNPNSTSLTKLAKFFNVSTDYFLDDNEPVNYSAFNELPEIAVLSKAMRNMTQQQRAEIVHYARYTFPNAFGG